MNNTRKCLVFKADIKHYFEEVNHKILIQIIQKKIRDEKAMRLIKQILDNANFENQRERVTFEKGMPLGNLTSQFFANVYLNELDQFVKHKLKAKHYIRYVDDFAILHDSKEQLEKWKEELNLFLREILKIELHPSKSKVLRLNSGINFLGFRIYYYNKLLRKSNMKNFEKRISHMKILYDEELINRDKVIEHLEGWFAYASHGNTYKYKKQILRSFNKNFPFQKERSINNKTKYRNFIRKVKASELAFSVQQTLFLYGTGMPIKDIATKRGIKESTV